jgi:hypothetical protein
MCRFFRKRRIRWVAGLLLLAYGSAGVLGYGLHELWGCGHHGHEHAHAEGLAHSHSHCHGHSCHHHHHEHKHPPHETSHDPLPVVMAADDCAICQFLAQAQPLSILEFEACCLGSVSMIDHPNDLSYCDPFFGTCSARAPPLG